MNSSRIALIPIAHVAAEVVAYPLASEAGLALGLTSLSPLLGGKTTELWRRAEQDLLPRHPAIALDELVAIRDDLWFNSGEGTSLGSYLRGVAGRFLESRGARAFPRLDFETTGPPGLHGDGTARTFWRWMSFALPRDLLLAALHADPSGPWEVDAVSPLLDRRLRDKGFAEPHVHLNGCYDFARIWVSTLRGLAASDLEVDAFKNPGAALGEGKEMADWLLRAALARYVLAAFLEQRRGEEDLRSFLGATVVEKVRERLGPGAAGTLVLALEDLRDGKLPEVSRFASVKFLYRSLIDARHERRPGSLQEIWAWDPIAPLMRCGARPPEMYWMARGLRYLEEAQTADTLFAKLFWQTVRVRCLLYRHLVQRPMTPGLQWFVRFFKRIKPARDLFDFKLKAHFARELCGGERGLCSLEVRTSPEASGVSATFHEVQEITAALREKPAVGAPCEHGIVWHFTRDREGDWFDGKPKAHWKGTTADPEIPVRGGKKGNPTGYRYGRFYKQRRAEALAAARVLSFFPRSLEVVRGLDLCADEVGVPSWVMAPLIRYVRDAGWQASATLRERYALEVPPLRTAVHAGEDFVHLLTGLRRLDEAIDHLQLKEGDRLGHALCLGVEPKTWAARAGRLAIPREDRLFDLAWEWSWYSRCGSGVPGDRYALIQSETTELTKRIFGEILTLDELTGMVKGLHDEATLRDLGFPDRPYPNNVSEERERRLLFRYLTSPAVFRHGREIVWIDPLKEAEALALLQNELRKKVGQIGLTIEVNPSSNLLIGHLADVAHHPLWRLSPPGDGDGIPPLAVCIGSDDPLTFTTTLREEYQLLYDALLGDGHSEAVAHEWIERAREAGMSSRFTLAESRKPWNRENEKEFRASPLLRPFSLNLPP